eukprot:122852-Prymnesium_polylepis.1
MAHMSPKVRPDKRRMRENAAREKAAKIRGVVHAGHSSDLRLGAVRALSCRRARRAGSRRCTAATAVAGRRAAGVRHACRCRCGYRIEDHVRLCYPYLVPATRQSVSHIHTANCTAGGQQPSGSRVCAPAGRSRKAELGRGPVARKAVPDVRSPGPGGWPTL